jgi:homoserine kinase
MKITVRTPATSANLGSGFDCLGMALDLWATVTVDTSRRPNRGSGGVERLVEQGVNAVFGGADRAPQVAIEWDETIPLARGLGASAALRGAGIVAGNVLAGGTLDNDTMLALGTKLENHPDNIAPALFGGLQVIVSTESRLLYLTAPLPDDLKFVAYVPDFEMPTQEGRRRMPQQFSRADTVFNVSRSALLVAALGAGRYDLLDEATQDKIHQPTRSQIFPGLIPIMNAARGAGAAASFLSGGGSTVGAFVQEGEEGVAKAMAAAAEASGYKGRSIITAPTSKGAEVVETVG